MRICKAEQGSAQWLADRAGKPTASQFSRIVTPTGKLSEQRHGYMAELVGERLLGISDSIPETYAMQRGTELEPEAREAFSLITGFDVETAGLCLHDVFDVGASPDGLVQTLDGTCGLELKCPGIKNQMEYLVGGECPKSYLHQVQGCIFVTGAPYWYFMSYYPGLPVFCVKVMPDQTYQHALAEHLPVFCDDLDALEARIREEYNCPKGDDK